VSSNGASNNGVSRSGAGEYPNGTSVDTVRPWKQSGAKESQEAERLVSLYAGVGIVRGSDADSEWQVKTERGM